MLLLEFSKKRGSSKKVGLAVGDDQTSINFEDFCSQLSIHVSQIMGASLLLQTAEKSMKKDLTTNFKNLTQEILLNAANKKYIIKTIIRQNWPTMMEKLLELLLELTEDKWKDEGLQKVSSFREEFEDKKTIDLQFAQLTDGNNYNSIVRLCSSS